MPWNIGHNLTHFHRLAGWHFLNAQDYFIIRYAGSSLQQLPKTPQQLAFVFAERPLRIRSVSETVGETFPAVKPFPTGYS